MALFNELQNLMIKYHFSPDKKLAQHFIVDEKLIEEIIEEASLGKDDIVLEIGAGTGFLTKKILEKCRVVSYELDDALCDLLEVEIKDKNFKLVRGDFLSGEPPKFTKIISLPPYTISSKIMYKILPLDFKDALLVFQTEFVDKLVAQPGFKEYGTLSVLTQYYSEPEIIGAISSASFFPKPAAYSRIIKLKMAKPFGKVKDEPFFGEFLKSIFRFKNKNLENSLAKSFQFFGNKTKMSDKQFRKKASSLELKGEKVNRILPEEFVEIFNNLF